MDQNEKEIKLIKLWDKRRKLVYDLAIIRQYIEELIAFDR